VMWASSPQKRVLLRTFRTTSVIAMLALACTFSLQAAPTQSEDEAAREVTAGCYTALGNVSGPGTFDLGICLGVIKGLHYLSRDVCVPAGLSLAEIATVVRRFLDGRPERRKDDFREVSLDAMRSAWPCGVQKSI
jgi:hypothetical protein